MFVPISVGVLHCRSVGLFGSVVTEETDIAAYQDPKPMDLYTYYVEL